MRRSCCGKRSYPSRDAAVAVLAKVVCRDGAEAPKLPRRVYQCRFGSWHLTSMKSTVDDPTAKARRQVLGRDGHACLRCGCSVRNAVRSLQHRRARQAGGSYRASTNLPSNLITLCGTATTGCHGWVEANPTAAARSGWRLPQTVEHPEREPVMCRRRGRILIDNYGGYSAAETGSAA